MSKRSIIKSWTFLLLTSSKYRQNRQSYGQNTLFNGFYIVISNSNLRWGTLYGSQNLQTLIIIFRKKWSIIRVFTDPYNPLDYTGLELYTRIMDHFLGNMIVSGYYPLYGSEVFETLIILFWKNGAFDGFSQTLTIP